jgi:hypothetical protein
MTTKTEMTLENVKAGDRVICRKELSHPTFIIWKEYDIVIQGESLYIVSHTYDLFSINESTLEIINEHFTLVTREDVITLSNAAFMYIKGEQDSESIRKIYDEKVTDEINKTWWLNHHYYSLIHGILSPSMHEPNKHILSTSDYLLLLSAPESQAHLLTEKDLIVGNRFECKEELILEPNKTPFKKGEFYTGNFIGRRLLEYDTDKENVERILNRHFKLVSQPPVMEGKEENGMKNIPKTLFLIMGDEAYEETDFNNLEHEFVCWAQKRTDQTDIEYILKSESDKSISSLQSEVEQLKGLLKEAQPFCGTMLRGKIEHYTSK